MDKSIVRIVLEEGNYSIEAEKGTRLMHEFKLSNKTSVYCGDKNKIWCQGRLKTEVQEYLDNHLPKQSNTKVFIAYGRDHIVRDELNDILKNLENVMTLRNHPIYT